MYLKRKKRKKISKSSLHPSKRKTLSLAKISYVNFPPMYMITLIPKLLPLFVTNDKGKVTQAVILLSLEELASSSSLSSESPSLSSSSEAFGKGEGDSTKPPRRACHQAIRATQVFTWHNSSLRVSRRASMHWSYAMIVSRVIPPAKEEGADMDGDEEAEGAAISVCVCLGRS